jgi:hypothetical protein
MSLSLIRVSAYLTPFKWSRLKYVFEEFIYEKRFLKRLNCVIYAKNELLMAFLT